MIPFLRSDDVFSMSCSPNRHFNITFGSRSVEVILDPGVPSLIYEFQHRQQTISLATDRFFPKFNFRWHGRQMVQPDFSMTILDLKGLAVRDRIKEPKWPSIWNLYFWFLIISNCWNYKFPITAGHLKSIWLILLTGVDLDDQSRVSPCGQINKLNVVNKTRIKQIKRFK